MSSTSPDSRPSFEAETPSLPCVRPEDCLLVCALPLTWEQFRADVERGPDDNFARHQMRIQGAHSRGQAPEVWNQLTRGELGLLPRVLCELRREQVRVIERPALDHLRHMSERVVILVSHWTGASVELSDQMVRPTEIAECFEEHFDGTIDLTMCCSALLGQAIRARCGGMPRVILNDRPIQLTLRTAACLLAVRLLKQGSLSYVGAMGEAWRRIRKGVRECSAS